MNRDGLELDPVPMASIVVAAVQSPVRNTRRSILSFSMCSMISPRCFLNLRAFHLSFEAFSLGPSESGVSADETCPARAC